MTIRRVLTGLLVLVAISCPSTPAAEDLPLSLPDGVRPVWDPARAYREQTATRERICINGLWRWQPSDGAADQVPTAGWGYFKVPGSWPGITDYLQKDSQTIFMHPTWKEQPLRSVSEAWYQREITVPADWRGRRISVSIEYLNSLAVLYLDGTPVGELRFPGGELDITAKCQPGKTHLLSLRVTAVPLKGVLLSFRDSANAREVRGSVARRGLCGDVFLVSTPSGLRISDIKVDTSVRRGTLALTVSLENLAADQQCSLSAVVARDGEPIEQFTGKTFKSAEIREGRLVMEHAWKPDHLWDIHTPTHQYDLSLTLLDDGGQMLDQTHPVRFGFREFWIDGRDFYLNGTRIYLSAVPLDNAQVGAAWSTYPSARESLERLKSFGINFVYTHNYGCEPGSHLSFTEILRAADDVGMLVALSQPHFSHYDWQSADSDQNNGYGRHAEFYVRAAQNHPSVVAYSMNHNSTGYTEDMNPDMIDGVQNPRDQWAQRNAERALRAETIVRRIDGNRIIYHHSSGNLGSMHTSNFYPNFVPIQELSDWFEHWATQGVKPVFLVEYGAPFTWDWTMYRGWFRDQREFGSAQVPWEFCLAEWNAQFLGDQAYRISDPEKANLRWEAKQYRAGRLWHRWDYPFEIGSRNLDERYPVFARYITDNWRAFRTWGVSANSPWEHAHFWKPREGVKAQRETLDVDWDDLQRPGFSADYIDDRYERFDLAYDRSDWVATPAAEALLRNNMPLLAYIGGKPARFTSKDHNFFPGETVEKQLIVINNSRETVHCDSSWKVSLPEPITGSEHATIATGEQARIPVRFEIPAAIAPGRYELTADVTFSNGGVQRDSFTLHVLARPAALVAADPVALFDPQGQTRAMLDRCAIAYQLIAADADLSAYGTLLIGKAALTAAGPVPDIRRVREGLRVVVFEQTAEALEKRLGFRTAEYGLRQLFRRNADHPLLEGLTDEQLRDWRGESTILPPRLTYEVRPRYGPTVAWCDIPVTRLWRCGNQGNVASALIEKPGRGDFLPVLDGGFSLQYAPLMEYRDGNGMVLFCQVDVSGRSESDPATETLVRNLFQYVSAWKPPTRRRLVYAGEAAGKDYLESLGFTVSAADVPAMSRDDILVLGSGAAKQLASHQAALKEWLKAGGHLLALGLDSADAADCLAVPAQMKKAEHIAAYFEPFTASSLLAGIGPADVHNRDPRELPLVTSGASICGNGVLAQSDDLHVVFCQLVPWQFSGSSQANLRKTFRRSSFLVNRLLANMGAAITTPLLERFHAPVAEANSEKRWAEGLYIDQPEEWDDPYRFFRW